ncbi:hypothetical protein ACFCV3_39525 [Kribbella sp. NPDC056345]|uniref:hypothetical protein n=1 Tax=Kribbella sp. NPDC056345 TaxID=3345789 RepID=UPI0035E3B5FB
MTIWRSAETWRRVAQKQLRRSQAAVATRNWRVATVANQRAQAAIGRAAAASELTPKDEQVLASLHYDLTEIHSVGGNLYAALDQAEKAWQLYHRLDPTGGDPAKVNNTLRAEDEQAVAHAADALARLARLRAMRLLQSRRLADEYSRSSGHYQPIGGQPLSPADIQEQAWVREHAELAVTRYERLTWISTRYGEPDLARVRTGRDRALAALREL